MENTIITEEQAENFAKSILDKILPTLTEKLNSEFYDGVKDYLYEHYDNHKKDVEQDLIKSLADAYVTDPNNYKYSELRNKIYEENKGQIFTAMADYITEKNLERQLLGLIGNGYPFAWQWKDGIAKFILNNWNLFKDDKRFNSNYLREIQNLKQQVSGLISQIHELKGIEE